MRLSSNRAVVRVAALLALLTVAACADSPLSPLAPTSADFARGGGGKPPKPPKPTPTHNPILFIHGYNGNSATWSTMVNRFKADGWTDAELVNWSYNYRQSNATTAAQIKQKVDSILNVTGATKVDIITHSMGPLSARYYIRNLGGDAKVDALVSLGGANHGTSIAAFCFDASCVEMRPGSTFLANLNCDRRDVGSATLCDMVERLRRGDQSAFERAAERRHQHADGLHQRTLRCTKTPVCTSRSATW